MMKKLILLALVMLGGHAWAQQNMTMCHSATQDFARLANDANFRAKHESPIPYHYDGDLGKMITYATPDGAKANAFFIQSDKKTDNWLIVVHEWWGLNDHIKAESAKLYEELGKPNVLAIDLYDGKVATTADKAGQLMQAVKEDRAHAIINGAISFAGKSANIYTIGWCFGGGWSLQTAIMAGEQTKGCVMYYGMPEKDVSRLEKLNTDVLGLFAGEDKWITGEVVKEFAANMEKAGKKLTYKIFDGADHAFANPSNPNYDKAAAEKANAMMREYFKAHMQ